MEKETGFWPAIKDFFFRAGDFKGVSSRSQFWWVFLAQFLLGIVIGFVSALTGSILKNFNIRRKMSDALSPICLVWLAI